MHFTGLDEKGKLKYKGQDWTGPSNLLGFFGKNPGPGSVGKRLKRASRGRISLKEFARSSNAELITGLSREEINAWLATKNYQRVQRAAPARDHAGLNCKRFGKSRRGGGGGSSDSNNKKKKEKKKD